MNRLSVKRLAVLAGALLVGAAIAGPITFSNIPIINSAGQPVVQIVVGSQAKPSDGVVAANIAAVIGNLAYTSTPVTATVNGKNAVSCVPATTTKCTITNQQVWLGESGLAVPSGSYGFSALIGSVLNRGIKLGTPQYAKTLQSGTNTQYAYQEIDNTQASPAASPYYNVGVPTSTTAIPNYNGGGVGFSSFTKNGYDNILRVTPAEVPSLVSNFGPGQESEYLWVTGFPVYDQQAQQFALLDAGGALQLVFSKPIPLYSGGVGHINNAVINIAGENYTIVNGTASGKSVTNSTTFVQGGHITIAQSMTPLETVYVGKSISAGNFSVQLLDLGQPSNGLSPAALNVSYKGVVINTTEIWPNSQKSFNVSGQHLYVRVNQTFAGLYAYQKWAKIQLFSNEFNLTSGSPFNSTVNQGWDVLLDWVNTTGSGNANALQSIVIYNTSPVQTLLHGQSFDFLSTPAAWKLTFVGETLPTGNFDPLTITTSHNNNEQYQNLGTGPDAPTNITEPAQLLTVKSSIPNAFSYEGQSNNTITYDLTPYELVEVSNALGVNSVSGANGVPINVLISNVAGNFITPSNPVSITIKGYKTSSSSGSGSVTLTFNGVGTWNTTAGNFFNITAIQLSEALPQANVIVYGWNGNSNNAMAILTPPANAVIFYPESGYSYPWVDTTTYQSVLYNQQNGQPLAQFTMSAFPVGNTVTGATAYFNYSVQEFPVPTNAVANDMLSFDIVNSTVGISAVKTTLFQLNYSATTNNGIGTRNNVTYTSTTGARFNVPQGFRTEKGSEVATISPTQLVLDLAKSIDMLAFTVGPVTSTTTTAAHVVGPFGVGQATNLPNVTIANVTAQCSVVAANGTAGCTVVGLSNLSATPSVSQAITPVKLNTVATPLAVLDANANTTGTLIVIGSKYVNTIAAQIFAQNPSLNSNFGPTGPDSVIVQAFGTNRILVAGYYANQTVQAGNEFIQDLLSQASS